VLSPCLTPLFPFAVQAYAELCRFFFTTFLPNPDGYHSWVIFLHFERFVQVGRKPFLFNK
jgi:hypothetical protein